MATQAAARKGSAGQNPAYKPAHRHLPSHQGVSASDAGAVLSESLSIWPHDPIKSAGFTGAAARPCGRPCRPRSTGRRDTRPH